MEDVFQNVFLINHKKVFFLNKGSKTKECRKKEDSLALPKWDVFLVSTFFHTRLNILA